MNPRRPSKDDSPKLPAQVLPDLDSVHHRLVVRAVGKGNHDLAVDWRDVGEGLYNRRKACISGSGKDIEVRQYLGSVDRYIELTRVCGGKE